MQLYDKASSGRQRIMANLLRAPAGMSVDELRRSLGTSRNAVYQHVVALERDGLIERGEISPTKGRPTQTYRLTESGRSRFPRHYALLASLVLGALKEKLGAEALAAVLDELGGALAAEHAPALSRLPMEDRIEAVAALMRELGYAAEVEPGAKPGEPVLRAHNCVFHDLAREHPEVCRLDLALLGRLLDRPISHRECMLRGGRSCRFGFADEADQQDATPKRERKRTSG